MRSLAARVAALNRIDAVGLATEPLDMRAGTETALARVVKVFGAAHPHHAYLFANRRAIQYFAWLYEIEREVKDLDADERYRIRQARGWPIAEALHAWMIEQRLKVPEDSGTAKALNYSLKRWPALTRYLDDGNLPADPPALFAPAAGRTKLTLAAPKGRTLAPRRPEPVPNLVRLTPPNPVSTRHGCCTALPLSRGNVAAARQTPANDGDTSELKAQADGPSASTRFASVSRRGLTVTVASSTRRRSAPSEAGCVQQPT